MLVLKKTFYKKSGLAHECENVKVSSCWCMIGQLLANFSKLKTVVSRSRLVQKIKDHLNNAC